jgi:release factor glutamine methyltransferase
LVQERSIDPPEVFAGAPDPRLVAALRSAGCVFAEEEALLLSAAAADPERLALMLARRVAGEPLEQVLGWAEFCGIRLDIAPGVFVPRRRTERLVETARSVLDGLDRPAVVVDLCCGTGAIGVAVVEDVPGVELHAADIDPAAVTCARLNVRRGHVHGGDLYDALPGQLRGRVDLLLVNAPYVPTAEIGLMPREARLHESMVALDGGADGLELHRRVASGAPEWLAKGGTLLIETSRHQASGTATCCTEAGLHAQMVGPDDQGAVVVRAISGQRPSSGTMTR